MATWSKCAGVGALLVFVIAGPAVAAESKPAADEAVFELREVSVLDRAPSQPGIPFTRGQIADLGREPDKAVKAYPNLKELRVLAERLRAELAAR